MTTVMKNEQALEDNLSAFAHRFPVSGRVVHTVAGELGGVLALSERLIKQGLWQDVEGWMATGKPTALTSDSVTKMFGADVITNSAKHLDIPRESVEVQLAIGIPKFFASLGDEDEDKKRKNKKSRNSGEYREPRPTPP